VFIPYFMLFRKEERLPPTIKFVCCSISSLSVNLFMLRDDKISCILFCVSFVVSYETG